MNRNNWITTDPDNLQFRLTRGYTFKEFDRVNYPEIFEIYKGKSDRDLKPIWDIEKYWIEETINISSYTFSEILTIITAYYNGLDDLILCYKNNSENIIAECIFEYENGLYGLY